MCRFLTPGADRGAAREHTIFFSNGVRFEEAQP